MNNSTRFFSQRSQRAQDMSIEWEALPSLSHLLDRREAAAQDLPTWADTLPVTLDMLEPARPFHEPMQGLEVREMTEPDIFRAFFGQAQQANGAR